MDAAIDRATEDLLAIDKTPNMSTNINKTTGSSSGTDDLSTREKVGNNTPPEVAADLDNDGESVPASVDCSKQAQVSELKSRRVKKDNGLESSDTDEPVLEKSAMVAPSRTSKRIAEKIDLTTATDMDAEQDEQLETTVPVKKATGKTKKPAMSKKHAGASTKSAMVESKKTKKPASTTSMVNEAAIEALRLKLQATEDAHAITIKGYERSEKSLTRINKKLETDYDKLKSENRRLEKDNRLEDPRVAELSKEVRDLKKKVKSLERDLEVANKKVKSLESKDLEFKLEKLAAEKQKSANAVMVQRLKNQHVNATKQAAIEVTDHRVAAGVAAVKEKIQAKETFKTDKTNARSERVAEALDQGGETYQPFKYSNKQPAQSDRHGHRRSRSRSPDYHRRSRSRRDYYSSDDSYHRRKKSRRSSSRRRGYSSDDTYDRQVRHRSRSRDRSWSCNHLQSRNRSRSRDRSPSHEEEDEHSTSTAAAAATTAAGNSQGTVSVHSTCKETETTFTYSQGSKNN